MGTNEKKRKFARFLKIVITPITNVLDIYTIVGIAKYCT